MRTYRREISGLEAPRAHPWTDAASDPRHRYHDLKARPDLVRTSLEDFTPWNGSDAVEAFYRLLEWLNAPGGPLESNDCEFTGPHDDVTNNVPKAQECSGRLMILYRDLPLNLSYPRVASLESTLHRHLAELDPGFEWGAIGTTIMRARYVGLPVPEAGQSGYQLMLSFWAWGDGEEETMRHLERLVVNLSRALRDASAATA